MREAGVGPNSIEEAFRLAPEQRWSFIENWRPTSILGLIDALTVDNYSAKLWVEDAQETMPEALWNLMTTGPIDRDRVLNLGTAIRDAIHAELGYMSIPENYDYKLEEAHATMSHLCELANQAGIEVTEDEINGAMTTIEQLVADGYLVVGDDGGLSLTEYGETMVDSTFGPTGVNLN